MPQRNQGLLRCSGKGWIYARIPTEKVPAQKRKDISAAAVGPAVLKTARLPLLLLLGLFSGTPVVRRCSLRFVPFPWQPRQHEMTLSRNLTCSVHDGAQHLVLVTVTSCDDDSSTYWNVFRFSRSFFSESTRGLPIVVDCGSRLW